MRKPDYNRRVVVTGMGVVSPIGNDLDTVWQNLVNGHSGIGKITHFDTTPYEHKAGGEVHDFDVTKFLREMQHVDGVGARRKVRSSGFNRFPAA